MGPLREQVIATKRRIEDMLDKPTDSAARLLLSEVKALEEDMRSKSPATVEDRVKRIVNILDGSAKSNRIMNYEHIDMFKRWFEGLRETLRRMS